MSERHGPSSLVGMENSEGVETTEGAPTHHLSAARLKGRRIVIAGAGSGIGRRTAELFAEEGATLALLDLNAEGLQATALQAGGTMLPTDVTDEDSVTRSMEQAATAMGGIDGIVYSAGVGLRGSVSEVDMTAWRRVINVNLIGAQIVVRSGLPWLRQAPFGTVVNVASGHGLLPSGSVSTAYAASKGGLITLTRALAVELAPKIRVNSVCPGMVETPMTEGRTGDGSQYALKRIANTLEIAQAILFLTGPESTFITGVALAVDGGRTFH